MKKFMGVLIVFLFFCVGMGVAAVGFLEMGQAVMSKWWPAVEGEIVSSEVVKNYSRGEHGRVEVTYNVDVVYKYTVDGMSYTNDRVKFGRVGSSNPSGFQRVADKYKKYKVVSVYYKPRVPSESVLEPGVHCSTWFKPLFGLFFAGMGAFGIFAVLSGTYEV